MGIYKISEQDSKKKGYIKLENSIVCDDDIEGEQKVRYADIEIFGRAMKLWIKDINGNNYEYIKDYFTNSPIELEIITEIDNENTLVQLNGFKLIGNIEYIETLKDLINDIEDEDVINYFLNEYKTNIIEDNKTAVFNQDLNQLTGIEFEQICLKLTKEMGFEVEPTKTSGDDGIDLIAYNHQPFLEGKYIIQCKCYTGSVGEPILRDLYGVVMSERANKGILITTGYFTSSAISFSENKPLELINGDKFKTLLNKYNLLKETIENSDYINPIDEINGIFDYSLLIEEINNNPNNYKVRSFLIDKLFVFLMNKDELNSSYFEREIKKHINYFQNISYKNNIRITILQNIHYLYLAQLELSNGFLLESLKYFQKALEIGELKKIADECNKYKNIDDIFNIINRNLLYHTLINIMQIYNTLELYDKSQLIYKKHKNIFLYKLSTLEPYLKSHPKEANKPFLYNIKTEIEYLKNPTSFYLTYIFNFQNSTSADDSTYEKCIFVDDYTFNEGCFSDYSYLCKVVISKEKNIMEFCGVTGQLNLQEIIDRDKRKAQLLL